MKNTRIDLGLFSDHFMNWWQLQGYQHETEQVYDLTAWVLNNQIRVILDKIWAPHKHPKVRFGN
jgi:hypothetical protein